VTNAAINNLTIANGYTTTQGGGILNLGTLTVSDTTFSNNYAGGYITGGGNGGGAIYTQGALTVVGSTFTGNSSAPGGAILISSGTVTITSSTFTGNTALGAYAGGAILLNTVATATITDTTFSGNAAGAGLAGGIFSYGTISVANSILSGNTGGDCEADGNACPTNGSNGNVVGGSADLAPLGNYGGPTQTMIPLPGSVAICAIAPSTANGTDQRGDPRTTSYGSPTCQDSGSVQSNYAISFTTNPAATEISGIAFPAAITLTESGNLFSGTSVSIPVTLSGGATLSGSPVSASTSAGVASYSLTVTNPTAVTGLQLNSSFTSNSVATISAQSSSFGLNTLSAPTVTASFSPSTIVVGQTSLLTVAVTNPNAVALSNVQFSDTLPAGVTLVTETAGTCGTNTTGGGTTVINPAAGSFSITSNTLAANSSCYLTVQVQGNTVVTATNSTSTISSGNAPAGIAATATLTVNPNVTQLAFTTAPAAVITAGEDAGSAIRVAEENASAATVTTATDTITLTVSGPGGYSRTYTSTAANGVATFNLSGAALTTAGHYTYRASIAGNNTVTTAQASETVNAAVAATQAIASKLLTQGHLVTPFTPVTGSGGTAPLAYTISPGLPTGLSFSSSTGAISGTPSVTSAATTYTVTVTDANGATATASFSLAVDSAVTAATTVSATTLTVFQAATALTPVTGTGGDAPLKYSVSPSLPTGLSIASATGTITGTPTAVSAVTTYTVTITDANSASATASFSLAVNKQVSPIAVSASSAAVSPTQAVTLTAAVSATIAGTPVTPTGTVTFLDNGVQLGAAVNVVNGVAQLVVPSLPAGTTAVITAVYSGDGNFLSSTSSNSATVAVAGLDFTFTNTGTVADTAAPGTVAMYDFALAPLYGSYTGPVSFTVTGLPVGAVASFTPSSVAANGGATSVMMTVQTAAATAYKNSPFGRGIVLALLLLPFGMKPNLRDKLRGRMLLVVLMMAGLTAALTGCGSQNGFLLQNPQTYTLTVTATSGTLQHSQTVTLIVQ
jgi:uncharacterized repeat protein (TIGR01451 family)